MAIGNAVAFFDKGNNTAGDKTSDLRKANTHAVATFHKEVLTLVFFARFIQVSVQKLTGDVHSAFDRAADWRPVNMHVKNAHKDRNPGHRLITQTVWSAQFCRWQDLFNQGDKAICWRNHKAVVNGCCPDWIAEESECPYGHCAHGPRERLPCHKCKKQGDTSCDQAKFTAFGVNRWKRPFRDPGAPVCQFLSTHRL